MTKLLELAKAFEEKSQRETAAVSAIQFALNIDEGMEFLRYWSQGDFHLIYEKWPEAPSAVFFRAQSN